MKFICTLTAVLIFMIARSQQPIVLAENTLKVDAMSEQEFFYGFAEGDQLVFSFNETKGKELKEFEISDLNGHSLFMEYKVSSIDNKTITIANTGIYKFRFKNSNALAGRICKFKIQRIPENSAITKFNSTVYKRTIYDTIVSSVPEKFLIKSDTVHSIVVDQLAKVHSSLNANGNKTVANFRLPQNTIAWSYYIGVDQAGKEAYQQASTTLAKSALPSLLKMTGAGPLTALALGLPSYLTQVQGDEDIDYYLTDNTNALLFQNGQAFRLIKQGKVVNDFAKMQPYKGDLVFCFMNDNAVTGVSVVLKVEAIQVNHTWETRMVNKTVINSRTEMFLKN